MRRLAPARKPPDRGIFAAALADLCDDGLAAHQAVMFACPRGHECTVTFTNTVVLPDSWECRQHVPLGRTRGCCATRTTAGQNPHTPEQGQVITADELVGARHEA